MSAWRRKAIEALPEMKKTVDAAWSPMALWIELRGAFETTVERGDMAMARRIMDFARYCLGARDNDVATAAALGFIEHLHDAEAVRAALPQLASRQELAEWAPLLGYHAEKR